MIPTLAFQESVRARLLADPVIRQHVDPRHIRAASMQPEQLPAIHLSPTRAEILGRASGNQLVAEVSMMVSLWAIQDGSETAENIAAAAFVALLDAPAAIGFSFDEWQRPSIVFSDHAISVANASSAAISLQAVIRWHE